MVNLRTLSLASSLVLQCSEASTSSKPLVPFAYQDIPLGSITPNGWLRAEMETEAAGLAGHLYDFYEFVHESSWLNGTEEYSGLNEAYPYWINGLVPLAYGLNDQRLRDQVHASTEYVLQHKVAPDGWIGPEKGGYRLLWARTLLFLGWTNLVDANSTWEEPIVTAMHNFNKLMNTMLKDNGTGIVQQADRVLDAGYYFWFRSRTQDMMVSLQWLYDKHPMGQEAMLLENMQLLHHYGYKWENYFSWGTYIYQDLYTVPNRLTNDYFQFLHGVNVGEGLKAAAVIRRYTYNDTLIQTAIDGVNWTMKYHGAASGTVLADEREDGVNPYYGSETCTAVEVIFSQAYNYRALGNGFFADGAELAAYNALPGAMTGDWWAHVYMSQPNQPYSKNLSETPFYDVNTVGQTFGLEPNYPCCTVNHPQGLPKFTQSAWLTLGDAGLLHALLSPTTVTTTLGNGAKVTIECNTNYPFDDDLYYSVSSTASFDFYVRQPGWSPGSTLTTSSSSASSSSFDAATGLTKMSLPAGKSTLKYTINTPNIRTEPRANDTISVFRGQVLYAAHIGAEITSTGPHNYYTQELYPADYAPPQSRDYVMMNTTEWNLAVDPSTLVYHAANGSAADTTSAPGTLPMPIFAPGNPPMYMTVQACLIDWPLFLGSTPGWPIPLSERKCLGDTFEAKLVPYGSAELRMTELPTITLK